LVLEFSLIQRNGHRYAHFPILAYDFHENNYRRTHATLRATHPTVEQAAESRFPQGQTVGTGRRKALRPNKRHSPNSATRSHHSTQVVLPGRVPHLARHRGARCNRLTLRRQIGVHAPYRVHRGPVGRAVFPVVMNPVLLRRQTEHRARQERLAG